MFAWLEYHCPTHFHGRRETVILSSGSIQIFRCVVVGVSKANERASQLCRTYRGKIIFTEKLVHGTLPWRGKGERRTLFYKYVPWGVHWRDGVYDTSETSGLTSEQLDILSAPTLFYTSRWFGVRDSPRL